MWMSSIENHFTDELADAETPWTAIPCRVHGASCPFGQSLLRQLEEECKIRLQPLNRIQGPEVIRKNNFIINTGDNQTASERDARIKLNKQKYGLSNAEIKAFKMPKTAGTGKGQREQGGILLTMDQIFNPKSHFSVVEKIQHLERLQGALFVKVRAIEKTRHVSKIKKLYRPLG